MAKFKVGESKMEAIPDKGIKATSSMHVDVLTIPVYDADDQTVMDSVREAIEKDVDIVSVSYYPPGNEYCCIVMILSPIVSNVLQKMVGAWKKWAIVDNKISNWFKGIPKVVEIYKVADSFELGVERKLETVPGFSITTLWDTSREGRPLPNPGSQRSKMVICQVCGQLVEALDPNARILVAYNHDNDLGNYCQGSGLDSR